MMSVDTIGATTTQGMLADVVLNDELAARTKRRLDYFIPNYLDKLLWGSRKIVSIGCGLGYDVQLLLRLGYDVCGLDPGTRTQAWQAYPSEIRCRLREGFAEELPFGREVFDFAYALEVIEHVGCEDGIWKLRPDAEEVRIQFIESCLDMVKPGGRLFLSTSNRNCPLDPGHIHHYTRITDLAGRKLGIQLTVPWHRKNFVWSLGDVSRVLRRSKYAGRCTVVAASSAAYPAFARKAEQSRWHQRLARLYLKAVDIPVLRTSFLNPILAVLIVKSGPENPARMSGKAPLQDVAQGP